MLAKPRRGSVLALIGLMLAATSCDPLFKDKNDRLGITSQNGHPAVVAALCPGDSLQSVYLIDPETVTSDGSIPLGYLWKVVPTTEATEGPYTIRIDNDPPSGFRLTIPLSEAASRAPSQDAGMEALGAEGNSWGAVNSYDVEQLADGMVRDSGGRQMTMSEFAESALRSCG